MGIITFSGTRSSECHKMQCTRLYNYSFLFQTNMYSSITYWHTNVSVTYKHWTTCDMILLNRRCTVILWHILLINKLRICMLLKIYNWFHFQLDWRCSHFSMIFQYYINDYYLSFTVFVSLELPWSYRVIKLQWLWTNHICLWKWLSSGLLRRVVW
jgi:hypothetical protein